jgi:cellulose synthase/poly-beta-1,6-N-acetylglucosamine synthase-like glycosyltransferase
LIVIGFVRFLFEIVLTLSVLGLVVVGGSFLLLVAINIVELVTGSRWRVPLPPVQMSADDIPHVLVQIPVFNEPEMVADALTTAAALDWPRDKLHIQLLDDSSDDTPAIADIVIRQLRADGFDVVHVRREDRSGFKAGALGVGLTMNDAPFIAMLDVDFRPPSNWLRATVPYLVADSKAAFLQSRCEFSNYETNWLTRAQGMLLDSHFVVEQATRYRAGWLFQFNGTGGLWRRAAIASAGGWSAESLCEDLDLTVRAGLAGWHGIFVMEPVVPGLVPERVRHWRVQQRRWSNGFVQVARKLMGRVWTAHWPLSRKVSATALIMIQAFYPCAAIALVSLLFCLILSGLNPLAYLPLLGLVLIFVIMVAVGMTLVPYIVLRRGSFPQYVKTLASLPPLMTFVSVSNAPSILKTLFGRREHFKRTPKTKAPTRA